MSKERARSRNGQTGARSASRPAATEPTTSSEVRDHRERVLSMKAADETTGPGEAITRSPRRSGTKHVPQAVSKTQKKAQDKSARSAKPATGAPAAGPKPAARKPTRPTTGRPAATRRGRSHTGRQDGPLARRRRLRIRLLVALLLVVNVAVGAIWRDWSVSLAALIVSVVTAPLLAALLLRRRR